MPQYTVAFAGSGASTLENTKALLNDFFNLGPEDEEGFPEVPADLDLNVVLPVSESHVTESLMTVFDWTEYADLDYEVLVDVETQNASRQSADVKSVLKYATSQGGVTSVNAEIIEALKNDAEGREVILFLFWGEEGDENSEILLDLAASAGIPVKDVTAGLDDLSFDDPGDVAPEPEPEPVPDPEPEEKPRRRRRVQEEESKPLEDPASLLEPEEEKPAPKRRGRARTPEPLEREVETKELPEPEAEKGSLDPSSADEEIQHDVSEAVARANREAMVDEEANARFKAPTGNTEDVIVKALALKHEAKRRDINPEITNRVGYHPATPETAPLHDAIRKVTLDFLHILDGLVPDGREKALAFTNAEQAMFWANAAVARSGAPLAVEEPRSPEVDQEPGEPKRGRGRPRNDGEPTRPRSAAEKAVKEVWDEDAEEWVRAGRGRIAKGVRTRLVDPKSGEPVDG